MGHDFVFFTVDLGNGLMVQRSRYNKGFSILKLLGGIFVFLILLGLLSALFLDDD